jgi:hypothetical protein
VDLFLKIALTAFANLSERRHDIFHILTQLSEDKAFPDAFVRSQGLHILSLMTFPLPNHCTFCEGIHSPNLALLKLFNGKIGFSQLSKDKVKDMLRSMGVIRSANNDDAPNAVVIIRSLHERLIQLGYEDKYHETANTCIEILAQEQLREQSNPGNWDSTRYWESNTENFASWSDSMKLMIDELKGVSMPSKKELVTLLSTMQTHFSEQKYDSFQSDEDAGYHTVVPSVPPSLYEEPQNG